MKLAGTSLRPNVATSGQHEEDLNKWPMSRRLNVATPQRRDTSTSRRLNVATSFSITIIKRKRGQNWRVSKNARTRARKSEQQRPGSAEKRPTFVFSSFMINMVMFYRLSTCVVTSSMF